MVPLQIQFLGMIMKEKVLLEDLFDIGSSKRVFQSEWRDSGIPFYRAREIAKLAADGYVDNELYIDEELYQEYISKYGKPKAGDIMVTGVGTLGVCYIVKDNDEFYFKDGNILWFRQKAKNKVRSEYVVKAFNSRLIKEQIQKNSSGTTVGTFTIQTAKKVEFELPSMEEQSKIVSILGRLEKIIDKRTGQLGLLDDLIKSQFVEMFGDPVLNSMGWDIEKLKNLSCRILSGNTPKGGSQVYVENGIKFFRSQNVWKNRLEMDDIVYIDEEIHKKMANSSLKYQDILMTKTGRVNTENSSLGRAAMYLGKDDQANINGHVYLIRLNNDVIKEFVLFILTTLEYRDYIRSVCVGGIDKRQLNKEHIEEFPIILPPKDKQVEFVTLLKQVDKLKYKVQSALSETQTLFDSLMQDYFK